MLRAAIDIGSNSVLLLAAEVSLENQIEKELLNLSHVTSLGKDLDKNKQFIPSSMDDTYSALRDYKERLLDLGIEPKDVVVTATEASRVATNAKEFFLKIKNELGFSIVTITSEGEAYYTAMGVVSSVKDRAEDLFIMDIGGASTELIHIKRDPFEIISSVSLPVGSVRASDWLDANVFDLKMSEILNFDFKKYETQNLIAVAGTMTSLASIFQDLKVYDDCKLENFKISMQDLELLIGATTLDIQRIKTNYPYLSKRAPYLRAGAKVAHEIGNKLHIKNFQISTRGLRYGVLLQGEIDGTFAVR